MRKKLQLENSDLFKRLEQLSVELVENSFYQIRIKKRRTELKIEHCSIIEMLKKES